MSMMIIDHRMGKIAGVVAAIMMASSAGVAKASEDVNADDWARVVRKQ
jgi:hypothetical protein